MTNFDDYDGGVAFFLILLDLRGEHLGGGNAADRRREQEAYNLELLQTMALTQQMPSQYDFTLPWPQRTRTRYRMD